MITSASNDNFTKLLDKVKNMEK